MGKKYNYACANPECDSNILSDKLFDEAPSCSFCGTVSFLYDEQEDLVQEASQDDTKTRKRAKHGKKS